MKRMMREENIINLNIIETMRNRFKMVGQSLEITWGDWPHLLRGEDMVSNSWVPVSGNLFQWSNSRKQIENLGNTPEKKTENEGPVPGNLLEGLVPLVHDGND